ncbi:MAG: hypothetical protein PHD67_01190 [Oscillospiraceae bacterium]|nr:hypothetical protein [Oscillospiraceae bacterium]
MPERLHLGKIDAMAAIYAVSATLRRIDERLIDHGERVLSSPALCARRGIFPSIKKPYSF